MKSEFFFPTKQTLLQPLKTTTLSWDDLDSRKGSCLDSNLLEISHHPLNAILRCSFSKSVPEIWLLSIKGV